MTYKRITVHTRSYEAFSDLFAQIANLTLGADEEQQVEGVKITNDGDVEQDYLDTMKRKTDVAVLKVRGQATKILQHGDVFEILLPMPESTLA
ncbi:MAG TPA: NAD/NADP transhydrogenase alpha subunit [Bacilli bacterium]|nr:NAD/NADP transhydrogenase alpha subunit [Bacilli bacterium]